MKWNLFAIGFVFISCSLKDDNQAGVSITGNTGKISGIVMNTDQPEALSKVAVDDLSKRMVVILEEATATVAPETLQVFDAKPFLFDSLPDGLYQLRLEKRDSTLARLDSLIIEDGTKLGVTIYYGEAPPPSTWKPLEKQTVLFHFPNVDKANLYVIPELGEEVYSINISGKTSTEMELLDGRYRVFMYSMLPYIQGTTSDFQTISVGEGNDDEVNILSVSLFNSERDSSAFYARKATVSDDAVVWQGIQLAAHSISAGKVRMFTLQDVESKGNYSGDTIYANWTFGDAHILLVAEDGIGIDISESSVQKVVLSQSDKTGLRVSTSNNGGFDVETRKDLMNYSGGNIQIAATLNMVVVWGTDTILKVNENSEYSWNTLPAMFAQYATPYTVPSLPDHLGLWLRYLCNGLNEDGEPWSIESVDGGELRIVNYPHTGDIRTGLERIPVEGEDLINKLPKGTFQGEQVYQDSLVKVFLEVDIPYYMATLED